LKVYKQGSPGNIDKTSDLGKPLITDIKIASSFVDRLAGLIFKKSIDKNEGMLFDDCNSIHTFWMRFPLDVIFLESENRIIRIFYSLKPFRITPVIKNSKRVLEIKSGMALELGLAVNDFLQFVE